MAALSRVILVRGVNVGGKTVVPMATLRAFLENEGLRDVQTLLQSGNAVARGGPADVNALERRLERHAQAHLGVAPEFYVRTGADLRAIVDGNPFPKAARDDPGRFIVHFMKAPIEARHLDALRSAIEGPEICEAVGRQLYVIYPDGMGRSNLTSATFARALGGRGTARNWNTVLRLTALASKIDRS